MTVGERRPNDGPGWGHWTCQLFDGLLAVVVAPTCSACGCLLDRPSRGPVCAGCWCAIRLLTPPLCDTCGVPVASWRPSDLVDARCARCRRLPGRAVTQARSVGDYSGALRTILHALKYGRQRSLAPALGRLMRRHGESVLAGVDCAVPVPLHRSRRRQRGFNQATDLAVHLGPPVRHALRRVRRTSPQAGLPAARRQINVRGAFALRWRAARHVEKRVVLLVDDIWTTGATIEACARVLRRAGALEVRAITAARANRRPPL